MLSPIALAALRRAYELGLLVIFVVVVVRSWRARGADLTVREFAFGFAVTQSVELLAVAVERYRYPDWVLYFPPAPAWVPLGVGLGWAALVPCLMAMSARILGADAPGWQRSALEGAMAVGLDLVLDPAVSGDPLRMWVWRGPGMVEYRWWLLDVPVFNFVGWFLLIGASTLQLRMVEERARGAVRWAWYAALLLLDLAVAWAVMQLPW